MKKIITLSAMMLLFLGSMFAQKLSYQAVVRNSQTNELMVNATMDVTIEILDANNGVQYTENHTGVQSNLNGLITLTIGEGTTTNNMNNVDWNGASIKSTITIQGIDPITITTPVNAVPYALQAANAAAGMNETDPTVSDWAKETTKPTYNYSEIEGTPTLPTVNNDTLFINYGNTPKGYFTANANANTTITIPETVVPTQNEIENLLQEHGFAKLNDIPTVNDDTLFLMQGNTRLGYFTANSARNEYIQIPAPDLSDYVHVDDMKQAIHDSLVNFKAQLINDVTAMLPNLMNLYMASYMQQNLPTLMQPYLEQMNIHTASEMIEVSNDGTASFTLGNEPKEGTEVLMYVNGVMVGSTATSSQVISVGSSTTTTNAAKTVTYNPSRNYNYSLKSGDKVTFVYVY